MSAHDSATTTPRRLHVRQAAVAGIFVALMGAVFTAAPSSNFVPAFIASLLFALVSVALALALVITIDRRRAHSHR